MGNQLIIHETRHAHDEARQLEKEIGEERGRGVAATGEGFEGNPSAASPRLCAFQGRAKCTLDLVFNPSQSRATNEPNEQQRQRKTDSKRERDIDQQTARDMS